MAHEVTNSNLVYSYGPPIYVDDKTYAQLQAKEETQKNMLHLSKSLIAGGIVGIIGFYFISKLSYFLQTRGQKSIEGKKLLEINQSSEAHGVIFFYACVTTGLVIGLIKQFGIPPQVN
jgi:hypothetical protein